MSENSPFKRGIVREIDKDSWRAKVEFEDEDNVSSFWLSVPGGSATGMQKTSMPRVGQQVGCLVDWRGEDGMILGGLYSKVDKPPTSAVENDLTRHEDGAVNEHDPTTHVQRIEMEHADAKLYIDVKDPADPTKVTRLLITPTSFKCSRPITVGAIDPIERRGKT